MEAEEPLTIAPAARLLLAAVLALGLPPLMGESSTADESMQLLTDAEQITRECSEVRSRLILDQGARERERSQCEDLLRRGTRCLDQMAPLDSLSEYETLADDLIAATGEAVAAVVGAKRKACARLGPARRADASEDITIDPWAGADAQCGFVPALPGKMRTTGGQELAAVPNGDLARLIPARYRLAQALGLGTNRFACQPRWVDPIQVRRQIDSEWAIQIQAKVQFELIGRFEPASAVDGAEPAIVPVETIRVRITSQGREEAGKNRTAADFKNKKAYLLHDNAVTELLKKRHPLNPWYREGLPAAAAERGWLAQPVNPEPETEEARNRVRRLVEEKLARLREEIAEQVRNDPAVSARLETARAARERFLAHMSADAEGHSEAAGVRFHQRCLEALAVERLVDAGLLGGPSIERIGMATKVELDSIRRLLQAAAAPPQFQAPALALASHLNDLAAWSHRR